MKIQVCAEYDCGHPAHVVCAGDSHSEAFDEALTRIVMSSVDSQGNLDFRCPYCRIGAIDVMVTQDGQITIKAPVSIFLIDGAVFTRRSTP